MSNVTSLSLLKGAKAAELGEELAKPDAAPAVEAQAEDTVSVEVDTMSSDELDALVAEHGIEVPEEWSTLNVEAKRGWLKSQFEEAPAAEEVAQVEAEKPAKKKASKSKAVAAPALQGEVVPDDMLADLVFEIENMKEKQALELVGTLAEQTEVTFFKLGGVLSVIQANGWFAPYNSFREFVEKKHGIHYRKAVYWTDIYNKLAESKVPWDKVKFIGWTKLKEIAGVITVDNVDEWVKIAKENNTISLIETVKAHLISDKQVAIEDQTKKSVTTRSFKVHEDQKATIDTALAKAKEQSGTTVDTAALEFICLDYLGGQSLPQKLKSIGIEAALEALEKAFPNANIEVEITEDAA
jgi:hypothetical protein